MRRKPIVIVETPVSRQYAKDDYLTTTRQYQSTAYQQG